MKVRSHAALIGKKHDSTLLFRQGANFGKIPLDPLLDQRRILLERPAQRLLATQPHLRQQSTHRDRTELDAVLAPNQRADHRSRPERKGKLQLKRIFRCHGIVDPSQLRPRQPLRTPARLARAKRIPSASTIGCQPHKARSMSNIARYATGAGATIPQRRLVHWPPKAPVASPSLQAPAPNARAREGEKWPNSQRRPLSRDIRQIIRRNPGANE